MVNVPGARHRQPLPVGRRRPVTVGMGAPRGNSPGGVDLRESPTHLGVDGRLGAWHQPGDRTCTRTA